MLTHLRFLLLSNLSQLLQVASTSHPQAGCIPYPPQWGQPPMHRTVILIIVVITVMGRIMTGYDPCTAVAVVAACGMVAAGVATQLLGPPSVSPSLCS